MKLKAALKASGKNLIQGKYKIRSKFNRVTSAAHTSTSNFVNDFNSGGSAFKVDNDYDSPFRMGNTAEVLPALRRGHSEHRETRRKHRGERRTRRPRKVVYY